MTPDDIDTLKRGDWLEWHMPAKSTVRAVQFISAIPNKPGRITVWLGDTRRSVHIRNCTRPILIDGKPV